MGCQKNFAREIPLPDQSQHSTLVQGLLSQTAWIQILALMVTNYMILNKFLNLMEPQIFFLKQGFK